MIVPTAIGLMVGSPSPPDGDRYGTKRVVVVGLGLVGGGHGLLQVNTIMSNVWLGLVVRLVTGIGFGITSAPVTESIMGSLPPSRAGVGSAVNDTTRQTGGALGVAVIGSIFAARYHTGIGKPARSCPRAVRDAARRVDRHVAADGGPHRRRGRSPPRARRHRGVSLVDAGHLRHRGGDHRLAMVVAYRYLPAPRQPSRSSRR